MFKSPCLLIVYLKHLSANKNNIDLMQNHINVSFQFGYMGETFIMQIDCQFETTNLSRDFKTQNHINHQFQNVSGRFQSSQLKSCNIVDSRENMKNIDNKQNFLMKYKPQTVYKRTRSRKKQILVAHNSITFIQHSHQQYVAILCINP